MKRRVRSVSTSRNGFTLLEIMIVVAIIGLLSAIALPSFMKARERTRVTAFVNDLRLASDAFEMYALEQGDYPPDANRGVVPSGMGEYLPKMDWGEPTPLGGNWDWERNVFGLEAGLSAVGAGLDDSSFLEVDKTIDDGSLITGNFRKSPAFMSADPRYVYVMQSATGTP